MYKQEAQLSLRNRAMLVCKVVEVWQDFLSEYVDKKFTYICYRRLIRHEWIYYGSKNCVIYNSYSLHTCIKLVVFLFLFSLETPLRLSRNMLHGWKDNWMLAKPLAAFTYLSSIVSETMLKSMRKSKNRYFYHIFVSLRDASEAIALNVVWMERELHAYKLFQQFPSYSNHKCKKSPFSRSAAHIFVSPGDAPATITQYVAWMERQFNACQTPCSMYLSIFNSFRVIRCWSQYVSPKIAILPHFCFSWGRPCDNHAKCCMDGKRIRCLQLVSLHVPI